MPATCNCLVFDLGAESGRALLARFDGSRLALEEVHRFPNGPVRVLNSYHWDPLRLFDEIKNGIAKVVREQGVSPDSLGVDTWGVDFALVDGLGNLLGNPWHYRDSRTDGMLEEAFYRVPREEIFRQTGIQFMQINTLYQLLAMSIARSPMLETARTLLMMADLFNYWLAGERASEYTIATTSQCLDASTGTWAVRLLERMGIPAAIFPPLMQPATILGEIRESIRAETGAGRVKVVAPACHDTASAVAAVPAESSSWAYLSSGTWSLLGVEVAAPVVNEKSLALNFTNEGGVGGRTRLLKNITGLWILQECRRAWGAQGAAGDYVQLMEEAAGAEPFLAMVDPDARSFMTPGDMPARIREYCLRTAQYPPTDRGNTVRCILESLALKYRKTLESVESLTGGRVETVHIVGGGSKNALLNQFTANATARPVVAGPVEATAAGNALVQLLALGELRSLEEGRALIRRSSETEVFQPRDTGEWEGAYERFLRL